MHPSSPVMSCVITCSGLRPESWDSPIQRKLWSGSVREYRGQRTILTSMMSFLPSPPDRIVSLWSIRGTMAFCRVDTWGRGQGREDQTVMMENREEARLVMVENQEEACCAMVDN